MDAFGMAAGAEFGGDIEVAIHAAARYVGIELERPPGNLGGQVRPGGEGLLQAPLADEAPGTDDVLDDRDRECLHVGQYATSDVARASPAVSVSATSFAFGAEGSALLNPIVSIPLPPVP
jgi:hypothetical protein